MNKSTTSPIDRISKGIGLLGLLGLAGLAGLADPRLYYLSCLSFLSYLAYFRFFKVFLGHKIRLPPERIPILFFSMFAPAAIFFISDMPALGFMGLLGFLGYTLDLERQPQPKAH